MNSASRVVTIVFRFMAVCLVLWLAYLWIAYLLTPALDMGGGTNRIQELRLEGMFRTTVVLLLSGVGLYLVSPFLGRLVTRGEE
jgi:hypothetical protein